ncbi:uncharacterized protein BYT42DRAFT_582361 [Radiomyces spectabilis]|uniref:uncharacterized protein n=1 Tax=Radiomyces spectabilis TaxID=64574 RepID=UPI0022205225|nr:uncharacterized protein BYT42DRAFT_582361 [Radiomyces spectabilis]KAI8370429.1 hypothetical protein BYT42DRAFT_582361 [Radiomyces spectabilis]
MRLSTLVRPTLGIIFVVLTCLEALGLYWFLKGFLLTRQTLDLRGHRYDPWERLNIRYNDTDTVSADTLRSGSVPAKPPFQRTVIVLIDALRFDFILNMTDITGPRYYLNQLPVIQQTLQTHPTSSLLFQFRADPPTTTMQRVKGLMTGSLPTFIDAGANFATSSVGEDHLLYHLHQRYKDIYFMGDDTWVNLFPEVFDRPDRTFDSDSFKMFDLHTVDNNILSHLWPLMEGDTSWDLAIAHFLGVDHCGHTYGPSHPNMAKKLTQMNGVLERLMTHIDNETLLVVMGDHGMSVEGDHGGESVEELMSGLFLYSGRDLTMARETGGQPTYYAILSQRIHQQRADILGLDFDAISQRLLYPANASQYPVVSQIHLVPTLSYLLGVPISFGNLGAIIPELLYPSDSTDRLRTLLHFVEQFRINALQVYDYLHYYYDHTAHPGFAPSKLQTSLENMFAADDIMTQLSSNPVFKAALDGEAIDEASRMDLTRQLEQAILSYNAFLLHIIKYCGMIWAQFDVGCMTVGIVVLILSTCAAIWLLYRPQATLRQVAVTGFSSFCFVLTLVGFRYSFLYTTLRDYGWFEKMQLFDWLGAALAVTAATVMFTLRYRQSVQFATDLWHRWDWPIVLVTVLCNALTLGSNSFVIWEDRGMRFVTVTLCVWWAVRSVFNDTKLRSLMPPLLTALWIRITSMTGQCREEQFPYCDYIHNGYLSLGHSMDIRAQLPTLSFILVCVLQVVYALPRLFQRQLKGRVSSLILMMYRCSLVIVLLHTVVDIYDSSQATTEAPDSSSLSALFNQWVQVYLPRVVYVNSIASMGICLYESRSSRSGAKHHSNRDVSWVLLFAWSVTLAMLQRPLGACIVLGVPYIVSLLTRGTRSTLLIRLLLLHYLGQHLFFVTSHQSTLTSLPWKAAFVGFDDMNYYCGATLVILSTLAGFLLSWLGWAVLLATETTTTTPDRKCDQQDVPRCLFLLVLAQSIPTFLSSIFVLILRRHLMTWKIFAPRFLLQAMLSIGSHLASVFIKSLL